MILATYTKQPAEKMDYDIDYSDWIAAGDALSSATAMVTPSGLVLLDPMSIAGNKVKLWVSEGVSGVSYKIEVTTTTTGGRIKQDEIKIKVKEV